MNLFSLTRLNAVHNRRDVRQLLATAAGIAVGVVLLFLILASTSAMDTRSVKQTMWLPHLGESQAQEQAVAGVPLSDDEVVVDYALDHFGNHQITLVVVAATEHSTVDVPGISSAPAPGDYYASPALVELLTAHSPDLLGERYGTLQGEIGQEAVPGPESLLVIAGSATEQIGAGPWTQRVSDFEGSAHPNHNYRIIATIGALAVLIPVAVLISVVTALRQKTRSERTTTLRLLGATPARVAAMSAVETAVVAAGGLAVGAILFFPTRALAAQVEVEGLSFFVDELTLEPAHVLLTTVLIVLGAPAVAAWVTYRAGLGVLGPSRELQESRPGAWRVLPLALGLVLLCVPLLGSVPGQLTGVTLIAGFLLLSLGLLVVGPWLTWSVAALVPGTGAASVGALSRIRNHPRAVFRSVSGLVVAVFLVTLFSVGVTTTRDDVTDNPAFGAVSGADLQASVRPATDIGGWMDQLETVDGVNYAVPVHISTDGAMYLWSEDAQQLGFSSFPDPAVQVHGGFLNSFDDAPLTFTPAETIAAEEVTSIVVLLSAEPGEAVERARTALMTTGPRLSDPPVAQNEQMAAMSDSPALQYAGLANIGLLIAMIISVIALAAAVMSGIHDRRRVLGLQRLMGMPARIIRRTIALEAVIPFLTVWAFAVALGAVTASALVNGLTAGARNVYLPDVSYLLIMGAVLAVAGVAIWLATRTAASTTRVETVRFE